MSRPVVYWRHSVSSALDGDKARPASLDEMKVTIELFGVQRNLTRADNVSMPITGATVLRDALRYVESRFPALALNEESVLVAVNDRMVSLDSLLEANDIVCILPHIGGG